MGNGIHRLDLRGKAFANILQTISNGKKTLEFRVKAQAERKADEIEELLAKHGTKKLETLEALMLVNPLDLQTRLNQFGVTVADAVDFYCKHLAEQREQQNSQTLSALMDEWLAEKKKRVEQGTLRKATYETLDCKSRGYKIAFGSRPVGTITAKEIRTWIEGLQVQIGNTGKHGFLAASQVSKQHQLSYLSQFFIWCKKNHGVPRDNPCESITIQRNEGAGEVAYYSIEKAQAILDLSTTKRFASLLPYNAICLFSGVRSTECQGLTWANIDFEDGSIVVPAINAKTGHGRRVTMQPNLLAWLQWFKQAYSQYPLIPSAGFLDRKRQFRKGLAFKWLKNGLRHSAASYTLGAKLGDYGYLESNFGNSRTMLMQHYLNFPPKEVSLQFWAIMPK